MHRTNTRHLRILESCWLEN
uniref:Histone H1.1 n=1 Tax=Rhizophora mucronata TaxID=61149 RepID=A0A2P2L3H2_RHIMU